RLRRGESRDRARKRIRACPSSGNDTADRRRPDRDSRAAAGGKSVKGAVMAKQPKHSKLDDIASLSEQNAWLTSPLVAEAPSLRLPPELAGDPGDERLGRLLNAPEWPVF